MITLTAQGRQRRHGDKQRDADRLVHTQARQRPHWIGDIAAPATRLTAALERCSASATLARRWSSPGLTCRDIPIRHSAGAPLRAGLPVRRSGDCRLFQRKLVRAPAGSVLGIKDQSYSGLQRQGAAGCLQLRTR